ncbi:cupin domain-containing protein [Pararhizobium arenae]|uniref:cupin domain-containing protein n=1 Tax=Pararhizobium arenae TaxID=1856850 RepID=UPI000B21C10F|nr:cupin domain-containing protein [Pararhizobium arenae]
MTGEIHRFGTRAPSRVGGPFEFDGSGDISSHGDLQIAHLALDGNGSSGPLAAHVTVIVTNGILTLDGDQKVTLKTGQAAVLGRGTHVDWRAERDCECIVASYFPAQHSPGIAYLDPRAERQPSRGPSESVLLSPVPICNKLTVFESADGKYGVGYWDAEAYSRKSVEYDYYELMHLLRGEVTLGQRDESDFRAAAGEVLVVTPGSASTWVSKADVEKLWISYAPQ